MPLSEADRRLRIVQLCCWVPAFALLVPAAVTSRHVYFAMGTIPMSFSSIHALVLLYAGPKSPGINVALDLFFAVFLMSFMIPHWIGTDMGWGWGWHRSAVLNTFATMPMIVNFCIHTFFTLHNFSFSSIMGCSTCPHCQREVPKRDLRLLWDMTPGGSGSNSSVHSAATKQTYVKLPAAEYTEGDQENGMVMVEAKEGEDEGTPRASVEDESARLL